MKQHVLEILIPKGAKWYASDFRKAVGAKSDGALEPSIFNKDSNNRPLNQTPMCRFISTSKTVRFISDNENGNEDVAAVMPYAFMAAQQHFNDLAIKIRTFTVEKSASHSYEPIQYLLISGAKKKRNDAVKACSIDDLAKDMIYRELKTAYRNGVIADLPTDDQLNLKVITSNEIGLKIHESGNEYGGLVKATFMMNLELKGFWQVGNLKSKGFGQVIRMYPGFTR